VARIASTVLVVALLAATAAAFALTQGLKSRLSPIFGTDVQSVFSPVCGCRKKTAAISFKLREPDRVSVAIVDGSDRVVRTVERGRSYGSGIVEVAWDGRDDAGAILAEGEYRPRVHLAEERFTTTLPNPIAIDVTPPRLQLVAARPRVFSPDGDGRADRVVFRYRADEPVRGMLFVNGRRHQLKRFYREQDTIVWNGKADSRTLRPRTYTAELAAEDAAGNVGARTRAVPLTLRYVALGRDRITVTAGARFALRVSADAAQVRWSIGGRTGLVRPGTLQLRAPLQKGQFTLTLTASGHSARAAVFVQEPVR
jgi:hypothetical protein